MPERKEPLAAITCELSQGQREALRRIVMDWIDDGFMTPPYGSDYYDIFEWLEIEQGFGLSSYDIRRPR